MSAYTSQQITEAWTVVFRCKRCEHEIEYTTATETNHLMVTHMTTHESKFEPKPEPNPGIAKKCENYLFPAEEGPRIDCNKKYGHGRKHRGDAVEYCSSIRFTVKWNETPY